MLALLSPAKTMDMEPGSAKLYTTPKLLEQSQHLINKLAKMSKTDLKTLMKTSDKIAALNYERYRAFHTPFSLDNAKQAILAFKGDVYVGLDAGGFSDNDLKFAQKHIGILSGLYGFLRPLDLIQAYRLEMGTKLKIGRADNLYQFWGTLITEQIADMLKDIRSDTVINLASNEYFKSVKTKELGARLIDIVFREYRGEELKFISFNAKKARGLMARYIVKNRIKKPEALKGFDLEDYRFEESLSSNDKWFFVR